MLDEKMITRLRKTPTIRFPMKLLEVRVSLGSPERRRSTGTERIRPVRSDYIGEAMGFFNYHFNFINKNIQNPYMVGILQYSKRVR